MPHPCLAADPRRALGLLAFLATVTATGCGGPSYSGPELFAAGGAVTMAGEPIDSATVVFRSTGRGHSLQTSTDANGRFELSFYHDKQYLPGAPAGSYEVTISKTEPVPNQPDAVKELLPRKYGNARTSDLTAEVSASQPNEYAFDLQP